VIDKIEDEPVRFYLQHRAQIEAWAALKDETSKAAHQAMTTVGDRLAENRPAGTEILTGDDGGFDARLLYRPDWRGDDGRPMAAVGIGWDPAKIDFDAEFSWIGVWRGRGRAYPDPLVEVLQSSLAERAEGLKLTRKSADWPLFKNAFGPRGEFWWDDLRPWLKELEDAVLTVWAGTADDIEFILH
jgi:hypothetical protein